MLYADGLLSFDALELAKSRNVRFLVGLDKVQPPMSGRDFFVEDVTRDRRDWSWFILGRD